LEISIINKLYGAYVLVFAKFANDLITLYNTHGNINSNNFLLMMCIINANHFQALYETDKELHKVKLLQKNELETRININIQKKKFRYII
jgi:hypothetical protein